MEPGCGARFARNDTLQVHMRTHTDTRPYICQICKQGFKRESHLAGHINSRLHNTKPKEYHCPSCDTKFTRKSSRKRHIKAKHEAKDKEPQSG